LGVTACVSPPGDALGKQTGAILDICATAPEGALCDDKNVCTIFDVCVAGICKGSAAPDGTLCTDGNVCTMNDSCRSGLCAGDPSPDTTPCTDGDPCTVGDACSAGLCLAGAGLLACNDGIACTLDMCVGGVGCVFAPMGDCNPPRDAGPDATHDALSDGRLDATADTADAMMSGGDASDAPVNQTDAQTDAHADAVIDAPSDMLAPPDATVDRQPGDAVLTDTVAPIDAPPDTGPDDAGAGGEGGQGAAGTGAGGGEAGGAGGGVVDASEADVVDAGVDVAAEAPVTATLPVLRASGGACAVAPGSAPRGSSVVALALLALGLVGVRRRRSR
jgi:MYXO-CTERM domain-containing protein